MRPFWPHQRPLARPVQLALQLSLVPESCVAHPNWQRVDQVGNPLTHRYRVDESPERPSLPQ